MMLELMMMMMIDDADDYDHHHMKMKKKICKMNENLSIPKKFIKNSRKYFVKMFSFMKVGRREQYLNFLQIMTLQILFISMR